MTAPEDRAGGLDGNARGLVVVLVAVLVGVLLLWNVGGDDGGDEVATGDTTTTAPTDDTTTTAPTDDTTTTAPPSDRQPSEVIVIVLNGSGQAGAAGAASDSIEQAGYTVLEPGNAPATEDSIVYYAEEYQPEATAIALLLGKSTDVVTPLSEASLGGAEGEAMVVVVLGSADTPPADTETDTTTDTDTTDTDSTDTDTTDTTDPAAGN